MLLSQTSRSNNLSQTGAELQAKHSIRPRQHFWPSKPDKQDRGRGSLQRPPLAIGRIDQLVRGRIIRHTQIRTVPLQVPGCPRGERSDKRDLRHTAADLKVAVGGRTALRGFNPLAIVSRGAW